MRPRLFAMAGLLLAPLAAHADTLQYTYLQTGGTDNFSFQLPSSPSIVGNSTTFQPPALNTLVINGQSVVPGYGFTTFYVDSGTFLGGFVLDAGLDEYTLTGQQLFSGPATSPTLLTGMFDLNVTHVLVRTSSMQEAGVLTVTDLTSPVVTPEPSSLALLGTGILTVLGIGRRRLV